MCNRTVIFWHVQQPLASELELSHVCFHNSTDVADIDAAIDAQH